MVYTLSPAELRSIHEILAQDFADADDPISPPGIKSEHLLESAVGRQDTGFNGKLKYDTPITNAAALTYGICCNHPFYNGNKRASLVAMLCHLDKNNFTFNDDVSHSQLYDFMLKVAAHAFADRTLEKTDQSDHEVAEMARWIRKKVRRVETGERLVTYRELRAIVQEHGYVLEDPHDNSIDVVKYEESKSWLGLKTKTHRIRVMRMSWPGDGRVVGKGLLRDLRKRCGLTEEEGVDSRMFYAKTLPIDHFVSRYRGTLKRLAKV
jgi:death-on-curing protein